MSAGHRFSKPPAHHFTVAQRVRPPGRVGRPSLLTAERKQVLLDLPVPVDTATLRRLAGQWNVTSETVRKWRYRLRRAEQQAVRMPADAARGLL